MKSEAVERIEVAPGIFAAIYYDESPGNPWADWDGQPPILVHDGSTLSHHGEQVTAADLARLIPVDKFADETFRGTVWDAIDLPVPSEGFLLESVPEPVQHATEDDYYHCFIEDCQQFDGDAERCGWTHAGKYFDGLETLAGFAGVPCHVTVTHGYSQGDSLRLALFATPDWVKTAGIAEENIADSLKNDAKLYGSWAFGNVYGFILEDADGEKLECPDGEGVTSCWGFYGYDHKASGLIEDATSAAAYYVGALAEENRESFDAACRDIVTV